MAVRLVCRACGKRLKLPDGAERKRSAKCPKCLAPIDLTAALEASAYLPTVAVPGMATVPPATAEAPRKPPALLGEDDPLPYPAAKPPTARTAPPATQAPAPQAPTPPTSAPPTSGGLRPPLARSAPPPLPAGRQTPPATTALSLDDDPPLSLDDDQSGEPPAPPVPFRVPVRVLADSLRQVVGPCFAVLLPHGLFLEHEPTKPFLYVPGRCAAESPAPGELTITLPDGRAVTLRFDVRYARALARDTLAFLAGERPVPAAAEYRHKWWMLWAALIFALGLAGGPLVLSQTADLGLEFGLQVGVGFALVGLLANAAVVLFSRWSVPGQIAVMAGICVLVSGVFLFGATAFLAGRQKAVEQAKPDPPPVTPQPPPLPPPDPPPPVDPPLVRPPSHLDRAKKNGSSALEDGPADVTALALAPDNNTLGIGHADGSVRLWPLDQPTFDPVQAGPKADGPVLRVQFDAKSRFVFATTATGVVAAPRTGPPPLVARIPGTPVAVAAEPVGDRVRFAAVRGNLIQHRLIAEAFIVKPPVPKGKAGPYAIPAAKGDEITPINNAADPAKPGGAAPLTFLAWTPGGRLFAGQPSGAIAIWNATMKPEAASTDHKAAVKAWAACLATGNFATGDEQGNVALWPVAGGKPVLTSVLATPITGLSFNPTGTRLAVTDSTGWLVIWDVPGGKALHRVKRPTAVKAMAHGPTDDVILLAAGKTVEVWWLAELVK